MSTMTERLAEAIKLYPIVEDHPIALFFDSIDEIERLQAQLKRQGNAAKMGMDAARKGAYCAEENAKRLLAESNPAAIESERAANAELTGEVERLQARITQALHWIENDLRSVIRDVGSRPVEYNDLYECADKLESVLMGNGGDA